MDFRFSDLQSSLRHAVRTCLDGTHPPARLRGLDRADSRDEAFWRALAILGVHALVVPEAAGGLGLTLVECAIVAEELGRANVGELLGDTVLVAVPWLARRGDIGTLVDIASGARRIALAHPINPWIVDLDRADAVLTGAGLVPLPPTVTRLESVDPLRRLFAPLPNAGEDDLLLDLAALMSAAQLVGAAERMLSMATDYAKLRNQFGQPIGGFQAVKHLLANVAVRLEFARPVVWRAAFALQHDDAQAPAHVSHAKLAATDAAMLAAETAIQVHGAMGYTYEVDLHYWMKRTWALAGAWGDASFHQQRLDHAVIGGVMPIGPGTIFLSEDEHA
jgi:alkylation response protein AidB-like acyl-CoA dehydrogenase